MANSYSNGYQYSTYSSPDSSSSGYGEFTRLSDVISTNVQKVSQNVASMQKMVNQLGTPQDCESLRAQLHQVQHYTNQLVKDTNNFLKELSLLPNPPNLSDQKKRKILKEKLTSQFSEALKNFQLAQRNAAQKERASVMRARAHSGLTGELSCPLILMQDGTLCHISRLLCTLLQPTFIGESDYQIFFQSLGYANYPLSRLVTLDYKGV
ncbi:syntaxin-7 [Nephila pilipes]|uniref:Syntaxin-7 n=1 Tax=Nephila pilipes TaxID=299642 RepID=A0A8X6THK2_NEPPI|nr:syntaxin-7 [Nephila pilipes]